jgi:hypothetical protein
MAKTEQKVQVTVEEKGRREEKKTTAKTAKATTAKTAKTTTAKTAKATTAKTAKTTTAKTAKATAKLDAQLDAQLATKAEKAEKQEIKLTEGIKLTKEQREIAQDLLKGEFGEKAILRAQTPAMTRKGETYKLTKENLMEKLNKPINNAHHWHFLTLGYHTSGGKKVSHFERVTGRRWSEIEAQNLHSKNRLINFSTGSYGKHFIFIIPAKGETIRVKTLIGEDRVITHDNFFDQGNYLLFSNHGRSYRVGQFLAFQYGLHYIAIPRGTYSYSNDSNFQFDSLDDEGKEWILLSRRGNSIHLKDLHPLDLIEDLANGGDTLIRLIDNKPIR